MIHATFVMEQHIGHRAFYLNLRRFIDQSPRVQAHWLEVTYSEPGLLSNRWPWLKQVRGRAAGWLQVNRGLRKTRGDLTFFNTQVPATFAPGLVERKPYILSTDITPIQYDAMAAVYGHRVDRLAIVRRFKDSVNRRLFTHAARVIPWSTWARDSLVQDYGVDPERIEVIPPGVDTSFWRPNGRAEMRRASEPLRILFVGGDFSRKGGHVLLDAFRRLPPGQAELLLVTRSQIPAAEGVQVFNNLQPNSSELVALYQSADIFVLPTQAEAFGIAVVEASAVGLPVIAVGVGGVPDIVKHGQTGFLIPAGDVDQLLAHLQLLLEDHRLRRQMGAAGRCRVEEKFDGYKNAARIVEICEEAIASTKR